MRQIFSTALLAIALLAPAAPAAAVVGPPATIDGPSADILEFGNVAMAEDGTGGVVYRKRVDGRPHIFAAAFRGGRWAAPQRVDAGQEFESRWPRIAAGNGGRLVVVWTQDWVPEFDRLFSASLDPGATRFQAPVTIDYDIRRAFETYPSVAMNRGGSAYLVYRVVTDRNENGSLPPGYVLDEVRAARYNGLTWSRVGTTLDRVSSAPVRLPSADNSPKVAIDNQANGLVAWQEPDENLIDRVWARRLFGDNVGVPLAVSPQQWDGKLIDAPADQFAVSMAGFGGGTVAFRQGGGQTTLGGTRIMANTLPETLGDDARAFLGPVAVDGGPTPQPSGASAGTLLGEGYVATFASGGIVRATRGDRAGAGAVEQIGNGTDPQVVVSESERRVVAWNAGGSVALQERPGSGTPADRSLVAGGGAVVSLAIAGSGRGDAIAGFMQGPEGGRSIGAGVVDAPPAAFLMAVPDDWSRGRIAIHWDPAVDSFGPVAYTVFDGPRQVAQTRARTATLGPKELADGRHRVRVVATDGAGQTTETAQTVLVDRRPPTVRVRRGGRSVRIVIADGRRGRTAGVARRTTVAWGDGKRSTRKPARARHRYAAPGRYRIVVQARDRAGNRVKVRRTVVVR